MESGSGITPAEALRYAMSLPVATVISGITSLEQLEQNLAVARDFTPYSDAERAELLSRSAPKADKGEWERFKTTRQYDANEGRVAHAHPLMSDAAD
jgi:hypothetical protein